MDVLTVLLFIIVCALIFTYMYHFIKTVSRRHKTENKWPPQGYPLQCPDYYTRNGNECINTHRLASGIGKKAQPNIPVTNDASTACSIANGLRSSGNGLSNPQGTIWFGTNEPSCSKGSNCYCGEQRF